MWTQGSLKFKNPLTVCQVARLYELTDALYEVGATEIDCDGDFVFDESVLDYTEGKLVSGRIEDYNDWDYLYLYDPKTEKWNCYGQCFLPDLTDEDMIGELEFRGYTVTKEGE